MKLSKEDIEKLNKLAELYKNGEISTAEFTSFRSSILHDESPAAGSSDNLNWREPDHDEDGLLSENTFSTPAPEKTPQSVSPNSTLTNQQSAETKPILPAATDLPVPAETILPSQNSFRRTANNPSLSEKVGVTGFRRNRKKEEVSTRDRVLYFVKTTSIVSTLITFVVAIVLTVSISRSDPMEEIIDKIQPDNPAAPTHTPVERLYSNLFIKPLFGPQAVEQCELRCSRAKVNSRKLCKSSCQKLSLAEYARRITLTPLDPYVDANRVIIRCTKKPIPTPEFDERTTWVAEMRKITSLIHEAPRDKRLRGYGDSRLLYNQLFGATNKLKLPPNRTALDVTRTTSAMRASCLRANLALSEMALILSRQNHDTLSERYYTKLYQAIQKATVSAEKKYLALAGLSEQLENIG